MLQEQQKPRTKTPEQQSQSASQVSNTSMVPVALAGVLLAGLGALLFGETTPSILEIDMPITLLEIEIRPLSADTTEMIWVGQSHGKRVWKFRYHPDGTVEDILGNITFHTEKEVFDQIERYWRKEQAPALSKIIWNARPGNIPNLRFVWSKTVKS